MSSQNPEQPTWPGEDIAYMLASFTDHGRSLRSFLNHPQGLGICILTAGLLANSKLMISADEAVKSSFEIYSKVQKHVGEYQSYSFASNVENCFNHPEVEGD